MNYKTYRTSLGEEFVLIDHSNGSRTCIPTSDPDNTDYQAFLKYQAEGGKVYGADEEVPDGQANQ
jgi:hypothetical protein